MCELPFKVYPKSQGIYWYNFLSKMVQYFLSILTSDKPTRVKEYSDQNVISSISNNQLYRLSNLWLSFRQPKK